MAENEKVIIENENSKLNEEKTKKENNNNLSSPNKDNISKNGELSSPEAKTESLEKYMENTQKEKTVQQKIHENMAKQKEKKNIFQRVWGAIKKFVKGVGDLVSAAAVRLIYGKGAIQDLSKMEEMMMSPISDYKVPKEEKTKEKEAPEKEPEKQVEVKEVVKENRELTKLDEKLQSRFNDNENKQPFQNLMKSLGFEYENNLDKPGVITIIMKNDDLGKMLKCDMALNDFVKEPLQYDRILKPLIKFNDIRSFDKDHLPKMDHIINPYELRVKAAILSAGLNQILTSGKETSFEFNAYNQDLKMEITHTEANDYAKIITSNGQEFEVFKPNGPEFFAFNSVEKIQDSLENNMLVIEAEKALAEMQAKEAEIAHKQTISYKIEQTEVITNPERNSWDIQFDKILNYGVEEQIANEDNEIIIEGPESLHDEPQYDDDDISL